MRLVIAEKPSVAQSIARVLGAKKRGDGYVEGNGYLVSWCVGHLVELAEPDAYDPRYKKWSKEDLPILPAEWKYKVSSGTRKQFDILKQLMNRKDVTEIPDWIKDKAISYLDEPLRDVLRRWKKFYAPRRRVKDRL